MLAISQIEQFGRRIGAEFGYTLLTDTGELSMSADNREAARQCKEKAKSDWMTVRILLARQFGEILLSKLE